MDPVSAGLQLIGMFKGGAQSPAVTSGGNGTFSNQTLIFGGLPAWNMNMGGNGTPPTAQAFDTTPRADSLVMGLTGLSTVTGQAGGNGIAATQPAALVRSWSTLALVGAVAFGAAYFLIKKK